MTLDKHSNLFGKKIQSPNLIKQKKNVKLNIAACGCIGTFYHLNILTLYLTLFSYKTTIII